MNPSEMFNMTALAAKSGVDYPRLRSNLLARPDKVKLTVDEKKAIIKAASDALEQLTEFLS